MTNPKLLLIDDAAEIHRLVRAQLREEELEIVSAFDAEGGIRAVAETHPDVVLLDVDLPDSSGFEVCRRLKSGNDRIDEIPIIFLSAKCTVAEKIRGLDLGATDYITKPFDIAELTARIRASLRTKRLLDMLSTRAQIDGLTGLWNRAHFERRLVQELAMSTRTARPLSCILADVDRFKMINDQFGHPFGDKVLRAVSGSLLLHSRAEDVACRFGGEEFAILVPNVAMTSAAGFAERIRRNIEALGISHQHSHVKTTCSFGVADTAAGSAGTLVQRADTALYAAKHSGRNRVEADSSSSAGVANDDLNGSTARLHQRSVCSISDSPTGLPKDGWRAKNLYS